MPMNVQGMRVGKDKPVKGLNEGRKSTGGNDYGGRGKHTTGASNPPLSGKHGRLHKQGNRPKV